MRFLANENFPLPSIRALRENGFEVFSIVELSPGITDEEVLKLASNESLSILTFDRDYGELIFSRKLTPPPSLFYFRFEPDSSIEPFEILKKVLAELENNTNNFFIVVDRISIRKRLMTK